MLGFIKQECFTNAGERACPLGEPDTLFTMPADKYGPEYQNHVLEQYKLYVEMADKVTERRSQANTFFLTANTLLLSGVGLVAELKSPLALAYPLSLILASFAGIILSLGWRLIIISYRQLNTGKFKVVQMLETRLPCAPYSTEWSILGEGKQRTKYTKLTTLESMVPLTFTVIFIVAACVALLYE
jgi:hypothetical protein